MNFDALLSNHPFLEFFCSGRYGLILLSNQGITTNIYNLDKNIRSEWLGTLLERPISDFYHIPEEKFSALRIQDIDKERNSVNSLRSYARYPSKSYVTDILLPNSEYSNESQSALYLFRTEAIIFGVITFNQYLPAISLQNSDPMLITDERGKITAFNDAFLILHGKSTPKDLLNNNKLRTLLQFKVKGKFRVRTSPNKPCPVKTIDFSTNERNELNYIPLKLPLDCTIQNFEFSLKLTCLNGIPPSIVIRAAENDPSDKRGFLIGPTDEKGSLILKKRHRLEKTAFCNPEIFKSPMEFTISYYDGRIRYYINRVLYFSYEDFEGFSDNLNKMGLSLAVRPHSTISINGSNLSASKPGPGRNIFLYARVKAKTDNLYRVHEEATSINGVPRKCWRLENITGFEDEIERLKAKIEKELSQNRNSSAVIGRSEKMKSIKETVQILAAQARSLLIVGETGTGKEVLASHFHKLSQRADKPFIKLDCSSIPATLLESEMFGHEQGAYTGAIRSRAGKFEQAQGGTLFLDEIANISMETQAKLLGVIEDLKITRLGGHKTLSLDLNIVAASNRNMEELIKEGRFRTDLYYRLDRFRLELPPLRDRLEDLPEFCVLFIKEANSLYRRSVNTVSEEGYQKLYAHSWPGNVRELKNVINRAVLFCKGTKLTPELLETGISSGSGDKSFTKPARRGITRENLEIALRRHEGSITLTASEFGVSRLTIYQRMKRYSLNASSFRHPLH
ncbi:MAG: sigma-54-dependent Fis family transcriptional regulator [Fibrobacteres bacterium]|nr:sigma-54-dependent Fis family transcriptional regulator [Fibrobacterota bacterium]